jgi:DNA-binding response OmpR family regulator
MKKVLVVDDSQTILSLLRTEIKTHSNIEAYYAASYKEAVNLLREHKGNFHAALLDLNLPDAPNGEIVGLANSHHIPSVVLTGTIDEKAKKTYSKKMF